MLLWTPSVLDARGWSVVALDPGETTGWAWAVVGRKELLRYGAEEAVHRAKQDRSGAQAADSRFMCGQVTLPHTHVHAWWNEAQQATELASLIGAMGNMTRRTSAGAVPEITTVVIEDFILRERTKRRDLLSPVRCTAMVAQSLYQASELLGTELPDIVFYQSANAKSVVTNDRLKRWGLYVPGKRHAMDAVRHLVIHLRTVEEALRSI